MKTFGKIYTGIVFALLYTPILLLMLFSFNSSKNTVHFTGFTTKWYSELFTNGALLTLMRNTLIIAIIASVVATVLGTMAAVGIYRMKKRMQSLVLTVTNIPMTNPDIVTGISLALLFVFIGGIMKQNNILGFWTLLIAHITFGLPYVILSVLPKIRQMDSNLMDAALDLGCTPLKAFFKVMLPEIMPGIFTGFTMVFTLSLDDFVISYFVYGSGFSTLPIEIYNYTKKPMPPTIYALFTVFFAVILVMMILMNVFQARDDRKKAQKLANLNPPK